MKSFAILTARQSLSLTRLETYALISFANFAASTLKNNYSKGDFLLLLNASHS
jgi:hypothetical protein